MTKKQIKNLQEGDIIFWLSMDDAYTVKCVYKSGVLTFHEWKHYIGATFVEYKFFKYDELQDKSYGVIQ